MNYYCVKVGNEFYKGFSGEDGYKEDINNCTILPETRNYKKLFNEAKKKYGEKYEVKLMKVEFKLSEVTE